jgi:hypothetical protein
MDYRIATVADCQSLTEWNHQLIPDEGHRNPMDVPQLKERMREWLTKGRYTAIIFEENGERVAYAFVSNGNGLDSHFSIHAVRPWWGMGLS